jgi:hypothetical protein
MLRLYAILQHKLLIEDAFELLGESKDIANDPILLLESEQR